MTVFLNTVLIGLAGAGIGLLGSLTGLGGGFIVVPLLTLVFGVDIRYAIGASLVTVIATSTGSAAAFVRDGYPNLRVGMFLEIATTLGALLGAFVAVQLPRAFIGGLFGVVLLQAAWLTLRRKEEQTPSESVDRVAEYLKLHGTYPGPDGPVHYRVRRVPGCFGLMTVAGLLSGILGIGSGILKVLALDQVMGLPFKVSSTTSNFMIGVTAAASASVYLSRGYIDPGLAMPVVLGVLGGSFAGARLLRRAPARRLRVLFASVIACAGCEMVLQGVAGRF